MSNIPTPEVLLTCIQNLLAAIPQEIDNYSKLPKAGPGPVKHLLLNFTNNYIIKSLIGTPPPQRGNPSQVDHAAELVTIKDTLKQLSKAVNGLQSKANPSAQQKPPQGLPAANPSPTTYSAIAGSRPKNVSIILDLAQTKSVHVFRPRPTEVCGLINDALSASPHQQVRIAAVRWTAKGNLVVTGGPNVTLHQL
jgi:hypothetical protein